MKLFPLVHTYILEFQLFVYIFFNGLFTVFSLTGLEHSDDEDSGISNGLTNGHVK